MSALPRVSSLAVPAIALTFSLLVGTLFILAIGRDPVAVYAELLAGTLGSPYGFGQVLFKATPLIFTGLACALAFRAGLVNIGAEGQLYMGAFATAWVGFTFSHLPAWMLAPLCILGGALGGGLWGAIPGVLKARFGSHEVINTIMLNFIAVALTSYFVSNVFVVPETVHTPEIGAGAHLMRLERIFPALAGSPANLSFFFALAAAWGYSFLMRRTRLGYELRVVGLNPSAAQYAGIGVGRAYVTAMALSGGLAGLVGMGSVMGYKHYFESGFSNGMGFMGLAVALLARESAVGLVAAALFFGVLSQGGLVINTLVPKELVEILQGIVILAVIVSSNLVQNFLQRRARARTAMGAAA